MESDRGWRVRGLEDPPTPAEAIFSGELSARMATYPVWLRIIDGHPVLGPDESEAVAFEILRAQHTSAVEALYAWVVMPNH